jgi:hypothetical protein
MLKGDMNLSSPISAQRYRVRIGGYQSGGEPADTSAERATPLSERWTSLSARTTCHRLRRCKTITLKCRVAVPDSLVAVMVIG